MMYFQKIIFVGVIAISTFSCSKKTAPNSKNTQAPPPNQEVVSSSPNQEGNRPPNCGRKPQFSDLLSKKDSNKDGKLSASEVQGPLKNDFLKVDADKDGFITETEFKNFTPAPPPI
jgi:EF hand